jgi:hypothetical protein
MWRIQHRLGPGDRRAIAGDGLEDQDGLSPEKVGDQQQYDRAEQAAHEYDFLPGTAQFDFATANLVGRPFWM